MDNVFLVSGRKLKITSYSYIAISLICFSFQQQERLKEKKRRCILLFSKQFKFQYTTFRSILYMPASSHSYDIISPFWHYLSPQRVASWMNWQRFRPFSWVKDCFSFPSPFVLTLNVPSNWALRLQMKRRKWMIIKQIITLPRHHWHSL